MKEVAFRLLDTNAISREGRRVIACLIRPPSLPSYLPLERISLAKSGQIGGREGKGRGLCFTFWYFSQDAEAGNFCWQVHSAARGGKAAAVLDVGKRNSRSLPTATWKQGGKERVISFLSFPCALCAQCSSAAEPTTVPCKGWLGGLQQEADSGQKKLALASEAPSF